jgi:hypothetical protein
LVKELKETKVKYLASTETKKKGQGVEELDEDFLLFYSGVPKNERARAGVGYLLHKRNKERIKGWNFVNERIMTIDIKEENEE